MKRLAIFIGGLLVMPAFAEVAPIFIDDENALEYTDAMYDENGFLIIPDEEVVEETTETVAPKTPVKISRQPVSGTPVANRSTSTRAMPASSSVGASGRGTAAGNSSRVVASRGTTGTNASRAAANRAVNSRAATNVSPRTATTTATTSTRSTTNTMATRAAVARATGGASRTAATTTASVKSGVARTATTAGRATGARATTNVSRAATTDASRPSVRTQYVGVAPKVGDGVPTVGTVQQIGGTTTLYNKSASIRTPTTRMSTLTETSVAMSMEDMDDLAEMTDYCKAQYASCMDNYCNVLDDNQGRCSCSANLKNYAKAEAALKSATEELQDVAQKIQYIGLTKREVESLFTQTAAEAAMQSAGKDTSQLQTSLDKIKDMIIDVKSGGATSNAGSDFGFDLSGLLEFSFDSTGFDLGSLFGTSNTNSVNNQRGEQLYKTAAARCKTSVIKACTARGVDASLITNAYDLEIDRECIMYERSLNDSNDEMLATVRNAKNVLQKARLMVAQQKNTYDMRGCINALDECMQDDFVCGSEYENCLDPTGRYIVNGEIVVGSQPGHAIDPELRDRVASVMTSDVCRVNLYRTWDFPGETCVEHTGEEYTDIGVTYEQYPSNYAQNNAWGSGTGYGDNLVNYIEKTVKKGTAKKASENMSQYLQNKIGYVDAKEGRNYGMCISVLNKCQDYTYTGKGTSATYNEENDVIKQYLGRVLVQIKAKQDAILSEYAETCVADVTSCLSQNGYPDEDPNEWEAGLETTTNTTKANIAVNACRAQVVTCMSVNGYSIDTPTPTEMNCWVQGLLYNYTTPDCLAIKSSTIQCTPTTLRYCEDKSSCDANSGYWCASTTSCYSSLSEYTTYCTGGGEAECVSSGGYWCETTGKCVTDPTKCNDNNCMVMFQKDKNSCGGSAAATSMQCASGSSGNFSGWAVGNSTLNWTCSPSNSALVNALNTSSSFSNISNFNITQSTICTAQCMSNDDNLKFTVNCGEGASFNGSSSVYTITNGNTGFANVSQGDQMSLQGLCTQNTTSGGMSQSATYYMCNSQQYNPNDKVTIAAVSMTCNAGYDPSGGSDPTEYPILTIDCGNGTFFRPSQNPAGVTYLGGSGTIYNNLGRFRSNSYVPFTFVLESGYCSNSTSTAPNTTGYVCGDTPYTVGESIYVSLSTTCEAVYGSVTGEATVVCDELKTAVSQNVPLVVSNGIATFYKNECSCNAGLELQSYTVYCKNCAQQPTLSVSGNIVTVSGITGQTEIYPYCSGGTSTACTESGGFWCVTNSTCYQTLTAYTNGCTNGGSTECAENGGYWCATNSTCYPTLTAYTNGCTNGGSTECAENGGFWCATNSTCYPTLTAYNNGCTNGGGDNPATECTQNGGTYCPNGVCVYDGDCNDNYDEPGSGEAVVKFICDPNDSYNPANLNIQVLTGAFNSGAVDSHTFVSTVQAGNHTLPAGACTCTNGTFQNWIVDTTCPSRSAQVNKDLNMQEGCTYTFTPNCEPIGGGEGENTTGVKLVCNNSNNAGFNSSDWSSSSCTGDCSVLNGIFESTVDSDLDSSTLKLCNCLSGYQATGWQVNNDFVSNAQVNINSLLISNGLDTVKPVCQPSYNYALTCDDSCSGNGKTGSTVAGASVSVGNACSGRTIQWSCNNNVTVSNGNFTMPNSPVTCNATCSASTGKELIVSCNGHSFNHSMANGDGVSLDIQTHKFWVNGSKTLAANWCSDSPVEWLCRPASSQNNNDYTQIKLGQSINVTENTNCFARYEYNMTYDCNGGTDGTPDEAKTGFCEQDPAISCTPADLVQNSSGYCVPPTGRQFASWQCSDNGISFTVDSENEQEPVYGQTTCTAQWSNSVQPQYIPVNVD